MWLESLDLVLDRLRERKAPLDRVRGISGACQQHGSVFWSDAAASELSGLSSDKPLVEQLTDAFSHPFAPNWQDHSTQAECDEFDGKLGSKHKLAEVTGSAAHHVRDTESISHWRILIREDTRKMAIYKCLKVDC